MADIDAEQPGPAPGSDSTAASAEGTVTREVRAMARGSVLNLVGALCSQVALLLITLVLARGTNRAALGVYAESYAIFVLAGLLALSGLRAGVTRYVAVHLVNEDTASLRGTIRLAVGVSTGASIVIGAALFAAAPSLAHNVFHQPAAASTLRYVGIAIPLSCIAQTTLSATQGYRRMRPYALILLILEPLLRLSITVALVAAGVGVRGAMIALVASNATAALLGSIVLWRMVGRHSGKPRYDARTLFSFSTVNWVATLATAGLIYADTLILGAMRTSTEVGTYNVATRLVTTASFVMLPINMAFAPRISDLFERGDRSSLRVTYQTATSWILRLSLPATVVLVCFPQDLLRVFGRSFADATAVTVIFAIGKLVDAATGPCGLVLNMIGRPKFQMFNNVAVLILNVLLNIWWIPRYGITGSALAWTVSLVVVNTLRVVQVRLALGIFPYDVSAVKGMLAGAGALTAGLIINAVNPPLELVVGIAGVVLVYLGLLLAQGFNRQDHEAFTALTALLPANIRTRLPIQQRLPRSVETAD